MAPPDHGPVPQRGPGGWGAQTMKADEAGVTEAPNSQTSDWTSNTVSTSTAEVKDAVSV